MSRYQWLVFGVVAGGVVIRLLLAARLPLAFDEALYWRYSTFLAPGYLDHPFLNPLMIRIGTTFFGKTEIGVRFMSVVLTVPASWAVWRAGTILFADAWIGATSALLFNLTVVTSVGSLVATSDQIVVVTSCFLLMALAKLIQTDDGAWWLAIGATFGLGMCAKYTTAFFAIGILVWLLITPKQRRWLATPWPYAGAAIAAVIFTPTLLWNASHGWASIFYQANRLVVHDWTLRYAVEYAGALIGLATPPIFVLGCLGLVAARRQDQQTRLSLSFLTTMIVPMLLYFLVHSLHQRVQGNWPEPLYPAFAIVAAFGACTLGQSSTAIGWVSRWAFKLAAPFGLAIAAIVYLQASFALLPLGAKDPTSRILGFGMEDLAKKINEAASSVGARLVITTDYSLAVWIDFYSASSIPVVQINDRMRWANEPSPRAAAFTGPALYICSDPCPLLPDVQRKFASVSLLGALARERNGSEVASYRLYEASSPTADLLDPEDYIPSPEGRR